MSVQCPYCNKFAIPWTSMFNEAMFQEVLPTSLSNKNDSVVSVYGKYVVYAEILELADLGVKLHNATN